MGESRGTRSIFTVLYLAVMLGLFWAQTSYLARSKPREVAYSTFLDELSAGRVMKVQVKSEEILAVVRRPAQSAPWRPGRPLAHEDPQILTTSRLPGIDESPLMAELRTRGVEFTGTIEHASWASTFFFGWLLPFGLVMGIYWFVVQRIGRAAAPMQLGRSRAKIYDLNQDERITFADVAGVDEAEQDLLEVVRYLKETAMYQAVGARPPRGVLLVGPPGTGKTLLARAVAGEAAVPFFSLSGSEFVEMFVGLGAARVRDLFVQAKERSPCIVFIDELDAIGKSRSGVGPFATHDEREQTLNQLLVEMDGFDPGTGVVILAATNRPEVLDRALLRAGRFDRQVLVDRPDVKGRRDILEVHARKVKAAPDMNLETIAQRTPGMVGADLANVINEAALQAATHGRSAVTQQDLEDAVDRLQLGLKKQGRAMNDEEKRRVAYHEAGHALVALSVEKADPVHRVTIIPRQIGALGATLQLPAEERYLMTRRELLDRICVMLGGRAAEETVFDDISTGAENDLERATETARQMICRFGMSAKLGPVTFGQPAGARFLETPALFGDSRNFSEETARAIDAETFAIVEGERQRARAILTERRAVLEELARRLIDTETLERDEIERIAGVGKRATKKTPAVAGGVSWEDAESGTGR